MREMPFEEKGVSFVSYFLAEYFNEIRPVVFDVASDFYSLFSATTYLNRQ